MRYRDADVSVEWIADNDALVTACANVGNIVALDTEFMRTNTYYPVPGLYQLAFDDRVLLIDPQAIDQWQPLQEVLIDPAVVKIMHACLEDLELLFHHLNVQLKSVFDTQYANAFVTDKFSLSYAGLVHAHLGVELSKHETRSNWLQRPLSDEQIEYVVEDVIHLRALHDALKSELGELDRLPWFEQDMTDRECYEPINPSTYYRGLKRGWQLDPSQLRIFQQLCRWREETAQTENVPRNRVIWDEHLFNFARATELTETDIRNALPARVARKYGSDLLSAAQKMKNLDYEAPEPMPLPLSSSQGIIVKELRSVGVDRASSLGLAPELVARKRDLEECVRVHAVAGELTPLFSSWRHGVVGETYLEILDRSSVTGT